jgi:rubrerythrin
MTKERIMPDMTITAVSELLEQSIAIEKGIGELYRLFCTYYPEEKIFWFGLAQEEQKHANILEGLRPWVALNGNIDQYLLPDLNELKEINISIRQVIQHAENKRPTREIAFNLAHKIELTASELHYQQIITKGTENKLLQSMQELCGADKDHLKRIKRMMKTLNIELIK